MAYKNTAPATGESRGRAKLSKKRTGTTRNGSSGPARKTSAPPTIGDRVEYECPFCRDGADATYKRTRYGDVDWFIGCWTRDCDGRHLPTLAVELDLTEGATKAQIVAALRLQGRPSSRRGKPEPLPSAATFAGSARRLLSTSEPLRYLTDVRGLSPEVIAAAQIGWDGKRLLFPVFKDGTPVAYKSRLPKAGAPMRKPRGSAAWEWPLYPEPQREGGRTFMVEGELDALRLRSVGLPATSVTGGVDQWRDEWAGELAGLRVVVAFDVEFEHRAAERAEALTAAGVQARAFDLRRLGLTERNADLSDYLDGGGSVAKLRRVLYPRVVRRSS